MAEEEAIDLQQDRQPMTPAPELVVEEAATVVKKPHTIKRLLLGDSRLRPLRLKDEHDVALQIWDTAGQERFHRITSSRRLSLIVLREKGTSGSILVDDSPTSDNNRRADNVQ
ncbi:hypothetical protein SPRG_09845 [Saprolegnia parasitica CBS 223.65]|uniref:Uncharacterized protein n=1 Tax=Saprolegnia parasitica (strain CBS 223.65) TaxID=695850 RepID=A0A067C1P1_SAPPC|nr:hypothetical protein SPRG_09845 [Saprolegnia parasitica CBS 223.65]KDO24463.1 hypothetical protein SPRG_09845 [Saprolegnia parasitica CBS 223.65]|eukprot:XP_012204884.1 hypothetical protein SPRG_09845 [Saprolegnia parasitica CBS 223.65]